MDQTSPCQFPALTGREAYVRPLSVQDVKSCTTVESAFPEHERCSEEKFYYRLSHTPDLCLGLFVKEEENDRLIGHTIANRTSASSITEGSMEMPENWRSLTPNDVVQVDGEVIGNDPNGTTIAIHSVVIIPEFQGKGVGKALVKAYIRYIRDANIPGDRLSLIAHGHLIKFYESAGFKNQGQSECQFAGGGWFDLDLKL
ncbi:hypothetical protein PENSTE_c002G01303 [Penicillium steckii]|uniref:N-acetyltransferase domain-containing protein n=1 Tax=Penicillium steckii TaxID=303698 RepID=A0A1V6TVM5_9EURO|nr:hypothetical protein PENSTE_c002G01303 [Penicillium steckii]